MDEQKSSVSADGSGENSGTDVHQPHLQLKFSIHLLSKHMKNNQLEFLVIQFFLENGCYKNRFKTVIHNNFHIKRGIVVSVLSSCFKNIQIKVNY